MYTEMTNAKRAANAKVAQEQFDAASYTTANGQTANDIETLETRINDLICNLLHLARREAGVTDLQYFVDRAVEMHAIEFEADKED